ncbi:hypothetical protein FSPOR_8057 [Fusarium sporotrichioides]|uniref:Uncharacterized protein n=1 Tax=Fusarium sporotrichioides TaxID=5514 RepID=A0A395RVR0_FUSSP|nr:hypothetical protein FSPOR_8057 [Fusarium sporotrichioides]
MKYPAVPLAAVLSATLANATCVDGHREVISLDYTVEYTCGLMRGGDLHRSIPSETAYAKLCRQENGKESPRIDAVYMKKVDDDPFAADCESEKDSCLQRETDLKAERDEARNRISQIMRASYHNPDGYKQAIPKIYTMADCTDECTKRA